MPSSPTQKSDTLVPEYTYRIDAEDRILKTGGPWQEFAEENIWSHDIAPQNLQGQSIWTFIRGKETRLLYREIFRKIRAGSTCAPIPFRCDAPEERRFLELHVHGCPEDQIELRTRVVRCEPRPPVRLIDQESSRADAFVVLCSMCKKMRIEEETWCEIEEGLVRLRIFEEETMPSITHGLCNDCFLDTISAVGDPKNSGN